MLLCVPSDTFMASNYLKVKLFSLSASMRKKGGLGALCARTLFCFSFVGIDCGMEDRWGYWRPAAAALISRGLMCTLESKQIRLSVSLGLL